MLKTPLALHLAGEKKCKRNTLASKASIALVLGLLSAAPAHAGIIYDVNINGSTIDLVGLIDANTLGTFSPTAFDATLANYSITASNNGLATFLFTLANSNMGRRHIRRERQHHGFGHADRVVRPDRRDV